MNIWILITTHPHTLTSTRWSRAVAVGFPVIQRAIRWRLNCRCVNNRLSELEVKSAVCKCRGRAPSASASSCILVAVVSSPSSMMDFMMSPAALTIAREGCWKSLKRVRPRPATSSNTMSNRSASVVSLEWENGNGKWEWTSKVELRLLEVPLSTLGTNSGYLLQLSILHMLHWWHLT